MQVRVDKGLGALGASDFHVGYGSRDAEVNHLCHTNSGEHIAAAKAMGFMANFGSKVYWWKRRT